MMPLSTRELDVPDQIDPRILASRARIAEASRRFFVDRGYVATTIGDIADEAGVAVQTIYNTVGTKADVLSLVLDTVVAGSQPAGSVAVFMRQRTAAAASVDQVLQVLVDWFTEVHPRTCDVFAVVRDAAAVDPQIAELRRRRERQRFDNYHLAAEAIADRGVPGQAWSIADLAAAIWSVAHPDTYVFLTRDAGWDLTRYRDWITRQLHALANTGT